MTQVLLVGHGRMGLLVEKLAPEYGCEIAAIVTHGSGVAGIAASPDSAEVAIDFTTAHAVVANVQALAERRINVVIGTTGWQAHEADVRAVAERYGIGVLAASNFSIGLHIFRGAVAQAAAGFAAQDAVGAWIHEAHHIAKKDAPSGTALTLKDSITGAGYARPIDISSTRAGAIPGTHTVGFDGPSETVTLTHTVRDRAVFARGALEVARWLVGKRGWFTMDDYLKSRASL
ncbi:MAG TPA: 4-hydroxy-tetrahydrodipicolinate reductase [Vicinamibacterales bacterium]|nr:4-hydroxy-tetrahydrodipicolinate reductase [Vicinamibacterales bacterium]